MKLKQLFQMVCFAVVALAFVAAGGRGNERKKLQPFRKGEVLVKFHRQHSNDANVKHVRTRYGARRARGIDAEGLTHVTLRQGQTVQEAIAELSADSSVEYVQPNYLYRRSTVPNDALYASQWWAKNTGQTLATTQSGSNGNSVASTNNPPATFTDPDLESAWSIATDCSTTPVAVLDTGVNYSHEDLTDNMWTSASFPNHGYNFADGNNDPMDKNILTGGHGTHVAGIIGAKGNNGLGVAGVCWSAQIMALRAQTADSEFLTSDAIVQGLNFAVSHGAKIVNMSFGGSSEATAESTAYDNALAQGVLLVAAAGNDATDNDGTASYPCNHSGVLCVAALDQAYALASYSNFGATSVAVGAPGSNMLSVANAKYVTAAGDYMNQAVIPAGAVDDLTTGWSATVTTGITNTATNTNTAHDKWALATVSTTVSRVYPDNYDGSTVSYSGKSMDARTYKTFDNSSFVDAVLNFFMTVGTQADSGSTLGDLLLYYTSQLGGDPVPAGTTPGYYDGTVAQDYYTVPMSGCLTSVCSFGFRMFTNSDATYGHGVQIHHMFRIGSQTSTSLYRIYSGTSMASPFVAGVAALVWTKNPRYTKDDVITAIKSSGTTVSALSGKVSTGKAVSAVDALKFIIAPTGVTATVR